MISAKRFVEVVWALAGVLFSKMFPLVGSVLLIRIFGPQAYGRYTLTVTTINLLLTATGAGLVGGLVANIAAKGGADSVAARRQHMESFLAVNLGLLLLVLVSSAAAALLGLLGDKLADVVFANWLQMLLLVIIQVQLASQSAVATVAGVLKRLAFTSLVGGVLATVLQVAGALQWSVSGALWGMALGYGIQLGLQARYLRATPAARLDHSVAPASTTSLLTRAWRDFVHYGGYMFGSSVIVSIGTWILSLSLLGHGTGMHQVAAFGVLSHWRMLLLFMPLALSNYLTARFASHGDPALRFRILLRSLVAAAAPLVVLTGGTLLLSNQVLRIYGPSYADLTSELYVTALIALLAGLNSIFGNFLTGSNLFREGLISNLVWFASLVTTLLPLRRDGFDAMDASISLLVAYLVLTAYQLWVMLRHGRTAGLRLRPART